MITKSVVCSDNIRFMRKLPDGLFKLIVTSPPYNMGKSYESYTKLDVYLAIQERVIGECARLLDDQGSICWQVGNYVENGEIVPLDTLLYPLFRAHGFKLRNRIIWHFGHGCTVPSDSPGATKQLIGGPKEMITRGILTASECRQNTLAKGILRVQTQDSCRGTRWGRTLRTFGKSRTSKTITLKKRPTPANFLLRWLNDWFCP